MRRMVPGYLQSKRAVSIASVLSAVGIWDLMDLTVRSLIEPGHSANLLFYFIALIVTIMIVLSYERRHDYDIIGGHLINS